MSDARLRSLERAARAGDEDAARLLWAERVRRGIIRFYRVTMHDGMVWREEELVEGAPGAGVTETLESMMPEAVSWAEEWDAADGTTWVTVLVELREADSAGELVEGGDSDCDRVTVPVHPPEPECCGPSMEECPLCEGTGDSGDDYPYCLRCAGCGVVEVAWGGSHEWDEIGRSGHGGGVVLTHICAHCGVSREIDTWATNRETGEQGLESVRYE